MVRKADKADTLKQQGVEAVIADLEKPWTLAPAFEGVDTVWLLSPPGPRAPEQQSNGIWAARQAGVKHIVRMSAVGAAHDAPTMNSRLHALSDAEVAATKIPYTIIKPHFFAQNFMMAAGSVEKEGAIYFALAEGKMGIVDTRDISEFAAKILTTSGHENKTYSLTGPASITVHQVDEALSKSIGKTVKYIPVPVEAARQTFLQMGMDKAPRSIEQFAQDFAGVFGKK